MTSWGKIVACWKARQQGPTAPGTSAQVQLYLAELVHPYELARSQST